jgi:lysophospholipase L1-like esterase
MSLRGVARLRLRPVSFGTPVPELFRTPAAPARRTAAPRASTRLGPIVGNVALLAVSLAMSAAAVEVFLRFQYPVGAVINETDDRLLFKLIPGSRQRYVPLPGNGASVLVKINARGYRGDAFVEPRRGTRVAVYGDSFVQGHYSAQHETFVARLQGELRVRRQDPALEVVNAGVAGYGPDQAARRMEDEVDTLAPDAVVLCLFVGNDFGDLARNRLFRLDPDGALVENHPVLAAAIRKEFDEARRSGDRPALVRAVESTARALTAPPLVTRFPRYIDDALASRTREYVDFVEQRSDVVDNLFWDTYDADIALEPDSPSARFKTRLMQALLQRIDHTLGSRGIPWVVVIAPDPIDVARGFEIAVDRQKYVRYDPHHLTTRAAEAARANGIPYVNLFDTLSEGPGEKLFFRFGDNHWNAAGQARAAAAVTPSVAGLLGRRHAPPRPSLLAFGPGRPY